MKKVLIYVLCFMSLFYYGNVSALEENQDTTTDQPVVDNNTPEETPEQGEDTNTPSTPDDSDNTTTEGDDNTTGSNTDNTTPEEPKEPTENVEEEKEEVVEQKPTQTTTNNNSYYTPTKPPTTYSYTTDNVTIKRVSVKISNIDLSSEKELAGSKLQIQDKDGKTLYEWESTSEAYIIDDMKEGTYYLVVVSPKEGYEVEKDKIEFVLDSNEEEFSLKVENKVIEKQLETISSGSILLLSIAMMDIAIGIWIVIYVKKNKVKE